MPSGGAGDPSQNASVNSRADSGGDAATATATTIPARLDGLKWILIGGFAAIFALGFVYLLRRPQVIAAGTADSAGSGAVSTPAYDAPPSKTSTKPAATSAGAISAEVDREVRGSLDELKDNLFRLELRRQAGTISEDDYTRERERIDATLRNLVRG
jgi:hypothetical protein